MVKILINIIWVVMLCRWWPVFWGNISLASSGGRWRVRRSFEVLVTIYMASQPRRPWLCVLDWHVKLIDLISPFVHKCLSREVHKSRSSLAFCIDLTFYSLLFFITYCRHCHMWLHWEIISCGRLTMLVWSDLQETARFY